MNDQVALFPIEAVMWRKEAAALRDEFPMFPEEG